MKRLDVDVSPPASIMSCLLADFDPCELDPLMTGASRRGKKHFAGKTD